MKFIIVFILFSTLAHSQGKYPADTLINSNTISITKKAAIVPIALWQRISYNSDIFNCQFYPSCSNYSSESIKKYGFIIGSVITLDRITRCNPFAYHYHLKLNRPFYEKDSRLIDTVNQNRINPSIKSPIFAGLLSALIPGMGRIYSGRIFEGLIGMSTILMIGNSTIKNQDNQQVLTKRALEITTLFLYMSEIYGAWRTAKYYQKK